MDPRTKWALKQAFDKYIYIIGKLDSRILSWYEKGNFSAILNWIATNTKWKWDDKISSAIELLSKMIRPFIKDTNDKLKSALENIDRRIKTRYSDLPQVKEEGKIYQSQRREKVQARRNNKTEQEGQRGEETMSKKKKNLSPEQRAARAKANAKVFNTILNPLSAIPNNLGYGVARNLEKLAGNMAYSKAMKQYKKAQPPYDDVMTEQQRRKRDMWFKAHDGENDLSWYNNYPELVNGLITPNFMRRKGTPQDYPYDAIGIPSVAGLQLIATRGGNAQGVVDASINKLLTSLRMANTGSQQYTTLDIDHYIYNVRAALIAIRQLRRVYGMITKFSSLDSNIPNAFFHATELPYDTFKDNSANLRMFLNYSSERLHVITPIKNDLMERSAWLCDYIFKDSDDAKVQYYIPYFKKIYYYEYSSASFKSINFFGTTRPYSDFISEVQTLIDNLLSFDRNGIIASDILKAFGADQMKYFAYIDENYKTEEVYSEEVLQQIQNATLWGSVSYTPTDGTNFIQESISHNFTISSSDTALYALINTLVTTKLINFYKDTISSLEVVGATRLTYLGERSTDSGTDIAITAYGTEILEGLTVVYNNNGTLSYDRLNWQAFIANSLRTAAGIKLYQKIMSFWADFDWAPEIKFITWDGCDTSGTLIRSLSELSLFDCNNVAKFTTTLQLQDVHNVANMSLYYSPYMIRETKVTKLPEA